MSEKSTINENGLRYASKPGGSPFGTSHSYMHSCILCGKHQPSAVMTVKRVGGTNFYRCAEPCRVKKTVNA